MVCDRASPCWRGIVGQIVIVDEASAANALARFLRRNGLAACVATSPEACYRILECHGIGALIVADRLRDIDGFEICRTVRARAHIPIIMLVPAGDETGKVLALEFGADDCLSKPVSRDELLARIRAVRRRYRRPVQRDDESIEIGSLRIEPATGSVAVDGVARQLTHDQFGLLLVLIRNAGSVVGRDELRNHLNASGAPATERSIDVHICRLRSLVEIDPSNPAKILTVRGAGYTFAPAGEDRSPHAA